MADNRSSTKASLYISRKGPTKNHSKIFSIALVIALISLTILITFLVSAILSQESNSARKEQFRNFITQSPVTQLQNYHERITQQIDPSMWSKQAYGLFNSIIGSPSGGTVDALPAKNASFEANRTVAIQGEINPRDQAVYKSAEESDSKIYIDRWMSGSSCEGDNHAGPVMPDSDKVLNSSKSFASSNLLSNTINGNNSGDLRNNVTIYGLKFDSISSDRLIENSPGSTAISIQDSSTPTQYSKPVQDINQKPSHKKQKQITKRHLSQRTNREQNLQRVNKKTISSSRTSSRFGNAKKERVRNRDRSVKTRERRTSASRR